MEKCRNEKKIFRRKMAIFISFMIVLTAVFFVLYCIVYERCYNSMHEDDLITVRFYRSGDDIVIVLFNKIYKLFTI